MDFQSTGKDFKMEMCYDGALVMPNNYAVVNEEEMTYVDGGAYISHQQVVNIVGTIGACAYEVGVLASALKASSLYVAGWLASFGPAGCVAAAVLATYICGQATNIASAFVNDLVWFKKGVDVTLDFFFGVPYACFTARH